MNDFTPRRKRLGYRKRNAVAENLTHKSLLVDCAATGWSPTRTSLRIGMQRLLVVDRDLFAGLDVSQSKEQHVTVERSHEGIRLAGVIDVVRSVAAARTVETEASVDVADAQDLTMACAPLSFKIGDSLAGVFGYLSPAFERNRGEAAPPIDRRFPDREATREFHALALYDEISPQRSQRNQPQMDADFR